MGAIGGLLGLNGGTGGTGFQPATLMQAVNPEMGTYQYDRSVSALDQQQQLLQALQGQNGLGNQTNALQAQQALAGQQQGTASQYQNLANGVGPNPAQAQLALNTAANVAQTGALMAGQRGGSQNVGLIARQAGQQGAASQQQAAGQAATLQAQQQIAGLQGLSAQQAQIGQTNQNVAQIAGSQAANQIGQNNAITGANQSQYSNILNAIGGYNNAQVGINSANAQLANTQMQGTQGLIGGVGNAIGGALGLAGGGEIQMAEGGTAFPGQSEFGNFLSQVQAGGAPAAQAFSGDNSGAKALQEGIGSIGNRAPGYVSPGDVSTAASGVSAAPMSGMMASAPGFEPLGGLAAGAGNALSGLTFAKGGDMRSGGKVSAGAGQKATKSGDSYSNDKIPAVLSEHEIVLPRSVTLSGDPVGNAAKFVQQVIAKRGRK